MPVTIEQNTAIKNAIRNDLRYIKPQRPNRWFYRRGAWRPVSAIGVEDLYEYIGNGVPGEPGEIPEGAPEVPGPAPGEVPEIYELPEEVTVEKAIINVATAALHVIIEGAVGRRIRIYYLTLTVGGEVNLTMYDGANPFTGAMDFGGTGEPRGVVMPHDGFAIPLQESNDFCILLSAAVQVSGYVLYSYVE